MSKAFLLSLFLVASLQAQDLASLPPYFDYHLRTDSLIVLKSEDGNYHKQAQDRIMKIGCRGDFSVEIAFSLSLSNVFLFEEYGRLVAESWDSYHPKGFELILYGVKKKGGAFDSIFKKRIDDYCVYGQHNYLRISEDYFIFTYQSSFNGGGTISNYENMGIWSEFIENFTDWLDTSPLKDFRLDALSGDSLIGQNFDWEGDYLFYPSDSIALVSDLKTLAGRSLKRENSARLVKLKGRDKATSISNYREPRANWFIDKAKWWRRQNLIYIWVEGWGLQVYQIHAPGLLLQLKHQFALIKQS